MRRRAWGSIEFRDGRAYAKIRIDGRRTNRLLYLEDGETPCPADPEQAEMAIDRLHRELNQEQARRDGKAAHLGEWLDAEYADILRSRLMPKVALQAELYIVRFQEWVECGCFEAAWARFLEAYDGEVGIDWQWQAADGCLVKAPLGTKGGPARRRRPGAATRRGRVPPRRALAGGRKPGPAAAG